MELFFYKICQCFQVIAALCLAFSDTYTVAATGGAASVTLSTAQMPSHSHSFTAGYSSSQASWATRNYGAQSDGVTVTTSSAGSSSSHENRPPYYAVAFIMKL